MPTIEFNLSDLSGLLGRRVTADNLREMAQFAKAGVEEIAGDIAKLEVADTNRPDLWSVEGIARELRGAYRIEVGLPRYEVKDSGVELLVEKKVEAVRPKVVAAVVRGIRLNDRAIAQLIQLQEKVALTFGRKRAQAAIGVYDFDKISAPVRYTTVKPDSIKFVPLDSTKSLTPKQILAQHPRGQEFGSLLLGAKEYPLLLDSKAQVLSMPPIINAAATGKVTPMTKNIFVEVTGHDLKIISTALNVIVAALADRGGKIETVRVVYGGRAIKTPDLKPREFSIGADDVRKLLGLTISNKEIVRLLRETRYEASESGKKLKVWYPAYRADIMHPRDVIEDVAISFGYNDFEPDPPKLATVGAEDEAERFSNKIRELMIGFGAQEVMTFTLTNYENLYKRSGCEETERAAEIANPISERFAVFRNWLIPSLLELLSRNTHVDYPQKIFEVGDVIWPDEKEEVGARNVRTLAVAIASFDAGYTDVKAMLDSLAMALGKKFEIKDLDCGTFIAGRCAEIFSGGISIGWVGEINPAVLNNWGLEIPVAALEIQIDALR